LNENHIFDFGRKTTQRKLPVIILWSVGGYSRILRIPIPVLHPSLGEGRPDDVTGLPVFMLTLPPSNGFPLGVGHLCYTNRSGVNHLAIDSERTATRFLGFLIGIEDP